jgi:ABC-type branched-subunit amino acid transport system substrate-binding protein
MSEKMRVAMRAVVSVGLAVAVVGCGSDDKSSDARPDQSSDRSAGTVSSTVVERASTTIATSPKIDPTVIAPPSRGFDGKSVTVAGFGSVKNFSGNDVGAKARFKRANDTDELNGIKINYLELNDDGLDPAIATGVMRKMITQDKIFAVVPSLSSLTPAQYMVDNKALFVGLGVSDAFCSRDESDQVWGFGFAGCQAPTHPKERGDTLAPLYNYVSQKTGKKNPSLVLFANDNQVGIDSAKNGAIPARGIGFNVVSNKGNVPATTTDYTPYIQQWIHADNGNAPDAIYCLFSSQCLSVVPALKAAGYKGIILTPLYDARLTKALEGTVAVSYFNPAPTEGLTQMRKDLDAIDPTVPYTLGTTASYFGADMFIKALKVVGTNITPDNLQQVLAHQTWEIPGLAGPVKYPDATTTSKPSCGALNYSDGTAWSVVVPFECYEKIYPIP